MLYVDHSAGDLKDELAPRIGQTFTFEHANAKVEGKVRFRRA